MNKIVNNNPKQNLNKLLIVGHEYSNYEIIQELLNKNGMEIASKLEKQDIEAKEISEVILKTNNISSDSSSQIEVSPIWNGLAMDLLISNMNKDFWGWADSDAVSLLNYWKSVDSNLAFILVYSRPEDLLKKLLTEKNNELTIEIINDEIQKWEVYNRKILDFYYRNNDCSLLVNSEQVAMNSMAYIEQLKKELSLETVSSKEIIELNIEDNQDNKSTISSYLVNQIINDNESFKNIYEELQSCANFPYIEKENKKRSLIDLLIIDNNKEKENDKLLNNLFSTQEELEKVSNINLKNKEENKKSTEYRNKIEEDKKVLDKKLNSLCEENRKLISEKTNKKKENEELLEQLFSTQEELEKVYNINLKNKEENRKLISENTNKNKENKELLEQLFSIQEELEKYFLQLKKIEEKEKEAKRFYGAGERIKRQLSYRLGTIMINNTTSLFGLLTLPFKLRKETKIYKNEQKNRKKLPPIHTYVDSYEAEKFKNHLSYKLGHEMIECFKSPIGIVKWPWAISKARKEYKESRKNV